MKKALLLPVVMLIACAQAGRINHRLQSYAEGPPMPVMELIVSDFKGEHPSRPIKKKPQAFMPIKPIEADMDPTSEPYDLSTLEAYQDRVLTKKPS